MPVNDSFGLELFTPLKLAFTYDSVSNWMKEGFAKEQCLEFQAEETIEALATALRKLGNVEMIGSLKALTQRLATSRPDWDLVFNFCEGHGTVGREAQVPALLEAWGIPFTFSDSAIMALCLDKAKTKVSYFSQAMLIWYQVFLQMILDHHKIPTAPFAVIPARVARPKSRYNPLDAIENSVHAAALRTFPLFIKPASLSTGIGISHSNKIANREELLQAIEKISEQYPRDNLLVERYLPGSEFTVGILGTGDDAQVIGVRELVFKKNGDHLGNPSSVYDEYDSSLEEGIYGYSVKMNWDPSRPNPWLKDLDPKDAVGKAVADVALRAWRVLGCRDAGRIDIRHDSKDPLSATPNFIEVKLCDLSYSCIC